MQKSTKTLNKNQKFNIQSRKNVDDFWLRFWDWRTVQRSALCRSRRELSNEYLLAKIGVDTAENGPLKVCQKLTKNRKKVSTNVGPPTPCGLSNKRPGEHRCPASSARGRLTKPARSSRRSRACRRTSACKRTTTIEGSSGLRFQMPWQGKRQRKFRSPFSRFPELFRPGSRLYRSQILQVNTRWKALAEIYTMHSFAPFSNRKIFVKNCWKKFAVFFANFCKICQILPNFAKFRRNFGQMFSGFFQNAAFFENCCKKVRWSSKVHKSPQVRKFKFEI